MRLICPNCNAQYEVPVEVIPEAGRDVQCSNCGHTWFQHHPESIAHEDAPDAAPAEFEEEYEDAYEDEDGYEDNAGGSGDAELPGDVPPPETQPAPSRRSLDPSVAEVLREEANREAQARRADSGGLESQPDLGLDAPIESDEQRRARQARERMAKMRGPQPDHAPDASEDDAEAPAAPRGSAAARSEMLPDVEEINQTLRAATDRRPAETEEGRAPADDGPGRSGFMRGLSYVIVTTALLIGVYIFAAPIAEQVPAAAPYLDTYVAQINDVRSWLQVTLSELTRGLV